jgi:LacI family transcriptional regulator
MPAANKRKRVLLILPQGRPEIFQGVQRFLLHAREQQAFLFLTDPWAAGEFRRVRRAVEHVRPDGVLACMSTETEPMLRRLERPVVCLSDATRTALPMVMMDQAAIGRLAAGHLIEQGLRSFAFAAVSDWYYAELRWRGFRGRLRQSGFDSHLLDNFRPVPGARGISDRRMTRWLAHLPKPVGIHLSDSGLVMQALWACQELGLEIPRDVALVGGQDTPLFGSMWDPTLSAVETDIARLGFVAMSLLVRLQRGVRPPASPVLIPPVRVVMRGSSDCLAARDPVVAAVRAQVRENAHRPIVVKELLASVALSRRTVERRFEKNMRHTLYEDIARAHMERAQVLLRQTSAPVARVAAESGYASYRVFVGAFRRHVRMTPTGYRLRESGR